MKQVLNFSFSLSRGWAICLMFILAAVGLNAQSKMNVIKSGFEVDGTSTLHDWTMKTTKSTGSAVFTFSGNKVTDIKNAQITIKVNDLKSHSSGLDKNAYNAMKASANPQIVYNASDISVSSSDGTNYTVKLNGRLTMGGSTKPLELTGTGKLNSDKSFSFSGSKKIDMTVWGVKPPSFMMGAMKTGKDVTIKYSATFK